MSANMGVEDRAARFILGIVLVMAAVLGLVEGWWAIATYALAAIMLVTSAVWYCPLYALFGWSTRRQPTPQR